MVQRFSPVDHDVIKFARARFIHFIKITTHNSKIIIRIRVRPRAYFPSIRQYAVRVLWLYEALRSVVYILARAQIASYGVPRRV